MSDIPTEPGVYRGLSDHVYRQIPAVSQSTLKAFAGCPQKFRLAPKKEPTPNMIWGSYVDAMWLSGDLSRFAVQPSTYETTGMRCPTCGSVTDSKKCAKCKTDRVEVPIQQPWSSNSTTCREWLAAQEANGKTILSRYDHERAVAACARLNAMPEVKEAREACDVQVAVIAEIEGILCKALIDMCPKDGLRNALGDLKTVPSADPDDWGRYVYSNRLHWQSAMYLDVWNNATGEKLEEFFHFAVEQEPPHEPAMHSLHADFIGLGREEYRRALRRYHECETSNVWPGYVSTVIRPEPFMLRKIEL